MTAQNNPKTTNYIKAKSMISNCIANVVYVEKEMKLLTLGLKVQVGGNDN